MKRRTNAVTRRSLLNLPNFLELIILANYEDITDFRTRFVFLNFTHYRKIQIRTRSIVLATDLFLQLEKLVHSTKDHLDFILTLYTGPLDAISAEFEPVGQFLQHVSLNSSPICVTPSCTNCFYRLPLPLIHHKTICESTQQTISSIF